MSGQSNSTKLIFAVIFAVLFVLVLWAVVTGRSQAFDDRFLGYFISLRDPIITRFALAITFIGNPWTMIGLCILVIILPGRMKVGIPVALMTGLGWLGQTFFKGLIMRPRPDSANWLVEEYTYSFPSGHSNASMIFWVALLILVGRVLILQNNKGAAGLLRVVFAIIAVLIGLSRPYLGVHYPTDVLGGWLLAGLILLLCFALYDNLWPFKWRVTYDIPAWGAIPRGGESRRGWREPAKKRPPAEMIQFPRYSTPWKINRPPNPDETEVANVVELADETDYEKTDPPNES